MLAIPQSIPTAALIGLLDYDLDACVSCSRIYLFVESVNYMYVGYNLPRLDGFAQKYSCLCKARDRKSVV